MPRDVYVVTSDNAAAFAVLDDFDLVQQLVGDLLQVRRSQWVALDGTAEVQRYGWVNVGTYAADRATVGVPPLRAEVA